MEITLVGLHNSGKSSLVQVICSNTFKPDLIATIGFNMRKAMQGHVTFKMWDLGGQPRFRTMWERYCRGVDAIVFVVDSAERSLLDESRNELKALLRKGQLEGIPLLVVGNKKDIEGCMEVEEIVERLRLTEIKGRKWECLSTSAKEKVNIDLMIKWLSQYAHKGK